MREEGFLTTSFSRQGLKDQKGGIRALVRFFWVKQPPLKIGQTLYFGKGLPLSLLLLLLWLGRLVVVGLCFNPYEKIVMGKNFSNKSGVL